MSRVYITGDTHGSMQIGRLSSKGWKEGKSLTKDDYLIVTGDFGLLWNDTPSKEEIYWTKFLVEKPWTTLFVDGNHDNHPRLQALPIIEKFGGKVGQVNDKIFYLRRGEIYTIYDKTFFCFGGARSRDIYWRTLGKSYWTEEIPNVIEQQYAVDNIRKVNSKVDYVVTHTGPDILVHMLRMDNDYLDPTTRFLHFLAGEISFERWFCGHFHLDQDIGKFSVLWDRIIQIF